ncbi:unnamed protein product [Linum trigynum]|uniref:Uncharacterized protein n=1 Tax=Linum trigynum TaxID=586398 RepID=A0AAV2CY75_9ROSI
MNRSGRTTTQEVDSDVNDAINLPARGTHRCPMVTPSADTGKAGHMVEPGQGSGASMGDSRGYMKERGGWSLPQTFQYEPESGFRGGAS